MKMYPITEEDVAILRKHVALDPETGVLRWIQKHAKKIVVGAEAGNVRDDGYRKFQLHKRRYLTHRVVYALLHGSCEGEIDHINRNPSDNRPSNLRAATRSQQNMNRARRVNKNGFSGVYRHPGTTKGHIKVYTARVRISGKCKSLGYYKTPEEAHAVYLNAIKTHHGEYALGDF